MALARKAGAVLLLLTLPVAFWFCAINVALVPAEGLRCLPVLSPHDAYVCGLTHG